ncbi:mitochondrial amidoxime-reducing component 1-like [Saccostrea cucullata]|uniref:mitochondrial amidoxime-reducing component 1-like n=1 Tax=Saccostrea cuccullata TaxID=36930 RepID=UPI002ED638FD
METFLALVAVGSWKYLAASWIRRKIEQRFQYFGTVSCLNLYPVKGCHATRVKKAKCGPRGLEVGGVMDRCIMVVDRQTGIGQYMRHFPKMTFINITVEGESVVLDAPGMESLILPHSPDRNCTKFLCEIHACKLLVRDFGDKASAWIGKYLGNDNLRLVYFLENNNRLTIETENNRRQGNIQISQEDKISFSCVSSYLLGNERTLEEISRRTTEPVKMDNFRPNIVIDGLRPFEEDTWSQIRIGEDTIFRCQEPCKRCMVTTIDPVTAERSQRNEPLKTLKTYKEEVGGVPTSFGVYAAVESGGEIHVGDQVYVLK